VPRSLSVVLSAMGSLIDMDLLQNIRCDRARQKRKQPYKRGVFNTVSCIVKGYGLGENFLKMLHKTEDYGVRKSMEFVEVKAKKKFEFPPFCLVSKEEYRLAMTIAGQLNNPYLQFARSPEEMLLSAPLYAANPSLGSDDLLRYDFETLLLCQRAKEELADLEKRVKQLQTFIAKVENTES
jgi:hypothetical protein